MAVYDNYFEPWNGTDPRDADDRRWFIDLEGMVNLAMPQIEPYRRAGIDGIGLWDTGTRAKPFDIIGINYVESDTLARTKLDDYIALMDLDPVVFSQHGQEWEDASGERRFHILSVVQDGPLTEIASFCGELPAQLVPSEATYPNGTITLRQVTKWTLVER